MNWVGEWEQAFIEPEDVVVSLGCGNMSELLDHVPSYPKTILKCKKLIGVDLFDPYLDFLRERGIHVFKWDLLKTPYPFATNSVDVVLFNDILEHLDDMDAVDACISEAERIAKKYIMGNTPRSFNDNEGGVEAWGLGTNPLQRHKVFVSPDYLRSKGFKLRFKKAHTFAVKRFCSRVLHAWDIAGVPLVMAKYQNRLGVESRVFVGDKPDLVDFNTPYADYVDRDGATPRLHWSAVKSHPLDRFGIFFKVARALYHHGLLAIRLRKYVRKYKPDVIHFHTLDYVPLFFLRKRILLEFHGTRARLKYPDGGVNKKRKTPRVLYKIYNLFKVPVFISTPDMYVDIPEGSYPHYMDRWIPNPVDPELFDSAMYLPRASSALFSLNAYTLDLERARRLCDTHKLKLDVFDRKGGDSVPHSLMSVRLSRFEYYIDRGRIHSLSKTALEALAMGLKVIDYKGDVWSGLPEPHHPEVVAEKTLRIYNKIMGGSL